MPESKYLILGSSHAALEALTAIRFADDKGSAALLTKDRHPPYSPTVLPYVVSGKSRADKVDLRGADWFRDRDATLALGAEAVALDTAAKRVKLKSGESWGYEKLLLATGAAPVVPKIPGLDRVKFHVLRSLEDALGLKESLAKAKRAVVLGAGLIGMHAAENIAKTGLPVTIVEMRPTVLAAYFDGTAAALIESAFKEKGIGLEMGRQAVSVAPKGEGLLLGLDDGRSLEGDLLLVGVGVKPDLSYLTGSGLATRAGILVDERMRTNLPDVWAAGDCAEAKNFLSGGQAISGILPGAVDQGRIAGADMAGDSVVKPYRGGLPINTYRFFGQQAISVGLGNAEAEGGFEIVAEADPDRRGYTKIVLKDGKLVGIATVNRPLDAGIMCELILKQVDLAPHRAAFLAKPVETGRRLMSAGWR